MNYTVSRTDEDYFQSIQREWEEMPFTEQPKDLRFVDYMKDLKGETLINRAVETINTQPHYKGERSLFKISEELNLNGWEIDIFRRLVRCRHKGEFAKDLNKIKDTVNIYLKEYENR